MRDRCCLILSFAITAAFVLSVHTCVIGCVWPISYNVIRWIMSSLPVTKKSPVSASAEEAVTIFLMLQFTCIGLSRRSRATFEGVLPKKNILQSNYVLPVQSDMTHPCLRVKIMSEA